MNFLKKAVKAGITPANILSWLLMQYATHIRTCISTFCFYFKALLLGIKTGSKIRANGKILLLRWPGGTIRIGNNVSLVSSPDRSTACALAFPLRLRVFGNPSAILIGDGCELSGVSITARSTTITLGNNVLLGPNCIIVDSDFHDHWPAETRGINPGYEKDAPVAIGDNVWIGMNCLILKGETIGRNSIVGAGSVVTHDLPENCVACGNPARIIYKYEKD